MWRQNSKSLFKSNAKLKLKNITKKKQKHWHGNKIGLRNHRNLTYIIRENCENMRWSEIVLLIRIKTWIDFCFS